MSAIHRRKVGTGTIARCSHGYRAYTPQRRGEEKKCLGVFDMYWQAERALETWLARQAVNPGATDDG